MELDVSAVPDQRAATELTGQGATRSGGMKPVALWLAATAFLVMVMVAVGGATRLTGSGLSITQWKPIAGALPPLDGQAWDRLFALYRATPQYRQVNWGMSLAQFQGIFWWEWAHRLLGRLLGVVFLAPMIVFIANGRLRGQWLWRCLGLLGLGALQGLLGWWMVKSGLQDRVTVAPERLAIHLGAALALILGLTWCAADAWTAGLPMQQRRDGWPNVGWVLLAGVLAQCLLGALVAGNRAGLIDNDWPWMAGRLIPSGYGGPPVLMSFIRDPATAQFNHRLFAYGLVILAIAVVLRAAGSRIVPVTLRLLAIGLGGALLAQALLGIETLFHAAPLPLALAHQSVAVVTWSVAALFAWRARRA